VAEREVVIELVVNDHPGAMSHVTGLFTRRAYNLERIVCGPIHGARRSRVILVVRESERIGQLLKDLGRLYDVLEVSQRDDWDRTSFDRIDKIVSGDGLRGKSE
jgi:acetolactate synthase-1/3 small subunit